MGKRNTDPLPREVELVKLRVQEWRQAKTDPCRVPSEIEAAAISLARSFGVCRIAQAVGLDYVWLRTKVAKATVKVPVAVPQFLELPAGIIMAAPLPEACGGAFEASDTLDAGVVIEISKADGARMRIRMESGSRLDAAGIVAAFLVGRRVC